MTSTPVLSVPTTTTSSVPVVAPVTAVVVTAGRTRYLARTLGALAAGARRPQGVLVVDVGGPAGVRDAVAEAFATRAVGRLTVREAAGAATFGAAVRQALADEEGAGTPWLWLLHDDSAPAPEALGELMRAVGHAPSVAVAGAKQRTWTDPERLLEVGLRTTRWGRRMTDVEPGELDQGQHDGRSDVLGVGLAGALVRRDVWDALGGTDPALGPFGDGFDLSRRARLAGHRVIVVPSAVVRHAQASYHGLRGTGLPVRDLDGDGEPDEADPRRTYAARRRAVVHTRLMAAPGVLLPVVVLLALAAAVVRGLGQLLVHQPGPAVGELRGAVAAIAHVGDVRRARAVARATAVLPRRTLRGLQASWRDVAAQWRDRRLARLEARKVGRAPSELELRELRVITTRRRVTLAALLGGLVVGTGVALGALVAPVLSGGRLVGGALAFASSSWAQVWAAVSSGWVADGLGHAGPPDALAVLLSVPAAVLGLRTTTAVLLLAAVPLAGWGAWAAAGAATRSPGVRAWAAVTWAVAPPLLLGLDGGRLGAVVAHLALPWVGLGLARAVGVQRVDQVVSGLATARRSDEPDDETRRAPAGDAHRGDEAPSPRANDAPRAPLAEVGTRPGGADLSAGLTADEAAAAARFGQADPTGSVAALAGAALALAVAVAGAPALLAPALLVVLVLLVVVPRRRWSLLVVPLPALLLLGPTLVEAAGRGVAGMRLLLAEPGLPSASSPASAIDRMLGLPADPAALWPAALPAPVLQVAPYALGAVTALLAVLALLRGAPAARAVRVGWVVAALGLAQATLTAAVPVTVASTAVTPAWTGAGISLGLAGLLGAAVLGADGLTRRLAGRSFGWRQPASAALVLVVVLVTGGTALAWVWQTRTEGTGSLRTAGSVVPAVGLEALGTDDASRLLVLAPDEATQLDDSAQPGTGADSGVATGTADTTGSGGGPLTGVSWQLLRGDGTQLIDESAAVATRALTGDLREPTLAAADAADSEVSALAAQLAAGATSDQSAALAALAVAHVLVPPGDDEARAELTTRLDATPGLQRVTSTTTGTLWRVAAPGADAQAPVTAWARLVPADGSAAVAVPSHDRVVEETVAGAGTLVLAERAGAGWHAWLDGRALTAVDQGWRQAFAVPAAGTLVVRYESPGREWWLLAQCVVLVATVLVALPLRRRRAGTS